MKFQNLPQGLSINKLVVFKTSTIDKIFQFRLEIHIQWPKLSGKNADDDLFEHYEKELGAPTAKYRLGIQGMGDLMIAMNPPAAQHASNLGNTQTLRPVEAL